MSKEPACPHYMGFTRKMCPKCYAEDRDTEAYERVLKRRGAWSRDPISDFWDGFMDEARKRGRS